MQKILHKFDSIIYVVCDVFSLILVGFLSERSTSRISIKEYLTIHTDVVYVTFTFLLVLYLFDLYSVLSNFRRYRPVIRLALANIVFAGIVVVIDYRHIFSVYNPYHDLLHLLSFLGLLLIFSYATRFGLTVLRDKIFFRNALLIGNTPASRLLMECIAAEQQQGHALGFKVVGYVADDAAEARYHELPRLGTLADLPVIMKSRDITLMIYALDTLAQSEVTECIVHGRLRAIPLISTVGLYQAITGRMPYEYINAGALIEECLRANRFAQIRMKDLFDRIMGAVLLLLSLPVMLVCALLIIRQSSGPVVFAQQRVGKFGRLFTIYKFCTMRPADDDQQSEAEGWHQRQEARITPLGKVLRRMHLDELPQLFNVVKGDMSLVGPRPEMEMFIRVCEKEIPFYRVRLDVKPGITGWAQVAFRHTSSLEAYREKFEYELYYLSRLSMAFDLEILARTAFALFANPSR